MAQQSYAYAAARTGVNETRLISQERLLRLLEASGGKEQAFAGLLELGYGGTDAHDYEEMIAVELQNTAQYLREITPNKKATDAFLLKYDCNNLKAFLKSLLQGRSLQTISPLGTIEPERFMKTIKEGDFSPLPSHMKEAAKELQSRMESGQLSPNTIDFMMDIACFQDMQSLAEQSGDALIQEAVQVQIDLTNVLMAVRVRKSAAAAEHLQRVIIPGGSISRQRLMESLKEPAENLTRSLLPSAYSALDNGMQTYAQTGKMSLLEKEADDYVMELFRKHRYEIFTIAPMIGYLLAKEREAQAVRILMVAKENGLPIDMVKERLREQYE